MKILDIIRCSEQAGDIGVEIEMEADRIPSPNDLPRAWKLERDGSLRGESGEFVLRKPVPVSELDSVFAELRQAMVNAKTRIRPTYRAGVHIHINVQDLTPKQLITFITCYFILEEVLLSYCDKSRVGNHFCLRMSDASYLMDRLITLIETEDLHVLDNEDLRYASLNVTSLFKYGSIEFRSLESSDDFGKIKTWARILHHLKIFAQSVNNPTDLLGMASERGFTSFARDMLGPYYKVLEEFVTDDKIRVGIRNIQYPIYSRNWDLINLNIFKKNSLFSS